ncbi:MAG: 4Fe-4S binding protein [bacterium]|nr:4Fe-4S binding protein [bacterium]
MRRLIQSLSAIAMNSFVFLNPREGVTLYQGKLKSVCVPILNCYSCPLAWGSCPIGTVQQSLKMMRIPYFVFGFFAFIGAFVGRWSCGNICPFGFLQEMLYKIKTAKIRIKRIFRLNKYLVLLLTLSLPLLIHQPVFCKFLCPAGTIEASIAQIAMNPALLQSIGIIFYLKALLAIMFVAGSITMKRFFCVLFCPIGAIYGLFNRISLLQIKYDEKKCVRCGLCNRVCPMDINIYENQTDYDCIRCFECVNVCPYNALKKSTLFSKTATQEKDSSPI